MIKEVELLKRDIKGIINYMIEYEKYEEAEYLVEEYLKLDKNDVELYSILSVIYILKNRLEDAKVILKTGLNIDMNNFDLNYNTAYVYNLLGDTRNAYKHYVKAYNSCNDSGIKKNIEDYIESVNGDIKPLQRNRTKIDFLVKPGMDSFIDDIIDGLSTEYETRKIIVNKYSDIDESMGYADICWFEWCDELIAYGTKHKLAEKKRIICRLHSYEAFTNYIYNVDWDKVDDLIFISESIKKNVLDKITTYPKNMYVIPNGIDTNKYRFRNRKIGKNIAYVGYLNYKKGPMLLLHAFKAIYDYDKNYKLYIAGTFQDERYILYFEQMIKEMGLANNVFYEGWQDDLDKWMNDKDYILCTSVLESQNMSVMQAMSKGIKPLIHNFVGAKDIYNQSYMWNTIGDLINMLKSDEYNPESYRKFIEENYSFEKHIEKILKVVDAKECCENLPLVTVGIVNYNYGEYLSKSIESVLKQTYKNIEILITDDCSTDNSREIIEEYKNKYSNIRVIYHEENSGSAIRGIKEVIKYSSGEFYSHLSADDFFDDSMVIENFMNELLVDSSLDYVYGNMKVVDKNEEVKNIWKYKDYSQNELVYETFKRCGSGPVPITNGIARKEFYIRNGIEWLEEKENTVAGDTLNVLHNTKYGWNIKYIDKNYISYRQHENNMTYNLEKRIVSLISIIEYIVQNFDEEIYLKNLNDYEDNKEGAKYFFIGEQYLKMLVMYLNTNNMFFGGKIDYDDKQIREFVQPLIEKIRYYMTESLKNSDAFIEKIQYVLEEIRELEMVDLYL